MKLKRKKKKAAKCCILMLHIRIWFVLFLCAPLFLCVCVWVCVFHDYPRCVNDCCHGNQFPFWAKINKKHTKKKRRERAEEGERNVKRWACTGELGGQNWIDIFFMRQLPWRGGKAWGYDQNCIFKSRPSVFPPQRLSLISITEYCSSAPLIFNFSLDPCY